MAARKNGRELIVHGPVAAAIAAQVKKELDAVAAEVAEAEAAAPAAAAAASAVGSRLSTPAISPAPKVIGKGQSQGNFTAGGSRTGMEPHVATSATVPSQAATTGVIATNTGENPSTTASSPGLHPMLGRFESYLFGESCHFWKARRIRVAAIFGYARVLSSMKQGCHLWICTRAFIYTAE